MRTAAKSIFPLGLLLLAGSIGVRAGTITWTLHDVVFSNGNVVSGFFATDSAVTTRLKPGVSSSRGEGCAKLALFRIFCVDPLVAQAFFRLLKQA